MLVPLLIGFEALVAGETCPAPVDVDARVRSILHLSTEQELSEGFVVERRELGLYVELRNSDATVIGQRTLPVAGTCDELAQAAAVVLSAWLSDVHPDFAAALPPAAAPEPTPPPVAAPELAPPALALQPPPPSPPSPPSPPPPPSSPAPAPRRLELALGVGADLGIASDLTAAVAASGVLVVDYTPPRRGWGVSGFAAATWPRRLPLGPGVVDWWRWPLGVGPSLRFVTAGVRWDGSVGPAISWLHFSALQLDRASSQSGFDWGAFLRLRAATQGRAGAFVQVDSRFFPRESGASARYPGGQWLAPVPSFSLGLTVGAWLAP